jgi:hypothetical protein
MLCLQLKSKWPDFAGRCWRYRGAGPSPSTTNSKPANSKRGFSELSNGRDGINAEGFVVPDGFDKARSLAAFKDIIPSCTPRCLVRHGRHPCCTARRKRSTSGLWSHPRRLGPPRTGSPMPIEKCDRTPSADATLWRRESLFLAPQGARHRRGAFIRAVWFLCEPPPAPRPSWLLSLGASAPA